MINDHADRTGTREVAAALMMSAFDLFMLEGATPEETFSVHVAMAEAMASVCLDDNYRIPNSSNRFRAEFYQKRRLRLRNGIIPR